MRLSFFLLFAGVAVTRAWGQEPASAGILQVCTTYEDEVTKVAAPWQGTSSVIEIPGKGRFLLTSAHLVSGSDTSIILGNSKLALDLDSGLVDADNDIALVPLRGQENLTAAAVFDASTGELSPSKAFLKGLSKGGVEKETHIFHNGNKEYEIVKGTRVRQGYSRYTWATPPWSKELSKKDKEGVYAGTTQFPPELVSGGKQVHVRGRTEPGTSGTLLVEQVGKKPPRIRGLLSQANRFFRSSYFTSDEMIKKHILAFLEGKRGFASDTRIKFRNNLTYRDYGRGTKEVNFLERQTGGGDIIDPGGGDIIDPGGGDIIDPGTGLPKPCRPKANAGSANFQGVRDVHGRLVDENLPEHEKILQHHGITFGMQYEGKTVIGFEAVPKRNSGERMLLYANPQAMQFMKEKGGEYAFRPVEAGTDLAPFALAKARRAFPKSLAGEDPVVLKMNAPGSEKGRDSFLKLGKEETVLTFPIAYDRKRRKNVSTDIRLDSQGRITGQKVFFPIVEVEEPVNHSKFKLDLRQLYFTDLADVAQSLNPGDELPGTFEASLKMHNRSIHVPVRSEREGDEKSLQFVANRCAERTANDEDASLDRLIIDAGKYSGFVCE